MKYKIGDKVKMKDKMPHRGFRPSEMNKFEGKIMTIANTGFLPFIGDYYQMKEGDFIWFGEEDIDRLIDEHKIVITTDGKTTTAKLYDGKKFIKEAKAKCSPDDEFDFETGATLAFSRLMDGRMNDIIDRLDNKVKELKQNRYFSGKAVWIEESEPGLTKGKIYTFENGRYKDNQNYERPKSCRPYTLESVIHRGFLPIKE